MITMLLGGLWHGASWAFIAWGALHGAALIINHTFGEAFRRSLPPVAAAALGWAITQGFVLLAWIPFRAESIGDAALFARSFLTPFDVQGKVVTAIPYAMILAPLAVDTLVASRLSGPNAWRPPIAFWPIIGTAMALAIAASPLRVAEFIYFQF